MNTVTIKGYLYAAESVLNTICTDIARVMKSKLDLYMTLYNLGHSVQSTSNFKMNWKNPKENMILF